MKISVEEVKSIGELKAFIKFPMKLFRNEPCYVPPLMSFELSTLDSRKNPAFDHAKARYWVARKGGKIVGRIAGIILDQEFEDKKLARFGWIDFVDDLSVSESLLSKVSDWVKSEGAKQIHGPMGFTDLDFEGTLIEGFDQLATQATIYNFPYYREHFEYFGFTKSVDWIEHRGTIPNHTSKRLKRIASICESRFNIRALKFKRDRDIKKYAPDVFQLLNTAYKDLYGYYKLTESQIEYYVKQYFGFIRKEFVSIIVNENDDVIGTAICLPSISSALQKAKGLLFPFGFIHILRAFKKNAHIDLFLIGVDPEYQKLGANAIIFNDILSNFIKHDVQSIATGPMLEDNMGVQNLWAEFESETTGQVRRRCFIKNIKD